MTGEHGDELMKTWYVASHEMMRQLKKHWRSRGEFVVHVDLMRGLWHSEYVGL